MSKVIQFKKNSNCKIIRESYIHGGKKSFIVFKDKTSGIASKDSIIFAICDKELDNGSALYLIDDFVIIGANPALEKLYYAAYDKYFKSL